MGHLGDGDGAADIFFVFRAACWYLARIVRSPSIIRTLVLQLQFDVEERNDLPLPLADIHITIHAHHLRYICRDIPLFRLHTDEVLV